MGRTENRYPKQIHLTLPIKCSNETPRKGAYPSFWSDSISDCEMRLLLATIRSESSQVDIRHFSE